MKSLPVDALLDELIATLRERPAVVLRSPTGSGKTTRVPVALERAGFGPVILVEPRRVAARAAARRMAEERGETVGQSVGYNVRFDKQVSAATRVTAMTEGLFLRRVLGDPFLEGVGCVVFDEFHERHLDGDLALSLVRQIQAEARDDLRVVILSATIEPDALQVFLDAAVMDAPGQLFPIDVEHVEPVGRERLEDHVVRGVRRARAWIDEQASASVGRDVLVFLPGKGEIARVERALQNVQLRDVEVVPLHGDLDWAAQDRALRSGGRARVILATNIAESSITIDGLGAVVDAGWMRIMRLDGRVVLDRLELVRISRPSMLQRMGRAGRTGPGLNVSLWSRRDEGDFLGAVEPEIQRVDLAGALLQVVDFGEANPAAFNWFEAPPVQRVSSGLDFITRVGALSGGLTDLGRVLARLPLAPRLGSLLAAGARHGVLERAALAAAILSERDVFARPLGEMEALRVHESDVLERIEMVEGARGFARLPRWAESDLLRVSDQLLRVAAELASSQRTANSSDEALLRALFEAFPDRVARVRDQTDGRALMVGGRGLTLSDECRVRASELIVAIELAPAQRGGRDDIVRQASVVRREWLGELDEQVVAHLDETTCRFITRLERSWKGLVIEDKPSALEGAALQAARHVALVEFARAKPERAFDLAADAVVDLSGRVTFARAALGEETDEAPPAFDPIVFVLTHVEALTSDKQSLQALKAIDLASAYMHQLSYTQGQALEREAPARLTLPNGETAALRYDPERGPILKVRIQQLFGWQATPTIGRARHPVLLELCAPNGRPQQITQDLAGFWSGSYQLVRKDLRGRYPKHPWPDDPASAAPVQRRHRSR